MRLLSIILALSAWAAGGACAQSTTVGLVTRTVAVYSDYESRIANALRKRDNAELDQLVAEDFEVLTSNPLARHVPRSDWIAESFRKPPGDEVMEQMAVHDYGAIRIVSFVLVKAGIHSQIVDVWRHSGDDKSMLATRYSSPHCAVK